MLLSKISILLSIHPFSCPSTHPLISQNLHPFVHSSVHFPIHPPTHLSKSASICPFIRSIAHPPTHSSLVHSHLSYCCSVWRPHLPKDVSFERMQKQTAKFVLIVLTTPPTISHVLCRYTFSFLIYCFHFDPHLIH